VKVVITPEAATDLKSIWAWNAKYWGVRQADAYLGFLERSIKALSRDHMCGKPVSMRPDLNYVQVKRKNHGHGHITVYYVEESEVTIVHVFHTAQDWQAKLT
jgi:plasmid stabilization system protein ParE